jgi:hypothetical protein
MTIVYWVLGVIAAIILIVLILAAMKPNVFTLTRRTRINAPPEKVAALILDFREWTKWSPFEKMDPEGELKRTFFGAARGLGAIYEWAGKKTGAGRMEIVEATPEKIRIQLDFTKPFPANNFAEYTIKPDGAGSEVTWTMYGPQKFMFKIMDTVIGTERMMGPVFEQGLRDMKQAAEAA